MIGRGISVNDTGARRLMAAILKQAYEDYTTDTSCPEWCTYSETCGNKKIDQNQCSAKNFIHSAWCATLCDGLDLDHNKYVEVAIKDAKLTKHTFKYIEAELRDFHQTIKELEQLKKDIILEAPLHDNNGGKSYEVSNTTYKKTERIILNKKLKRLEDIVKAVSAVYDACGKEKQQLIRMKYWQNKLTDKGIMDALCIEKATFYRWRKQVIYEIASELGYI
jgi:RinA family phage transcriptional activator